jgi:hypothetical protein
MIKSDHRIEEISVFIRANKNVCHNSLTDLRQVLLFLKIKFNFDI